MSIKKTVFLLAGLSLLLVFACGPQAIKPKAQLDTPEHHVSTGNKFLKMDRLEDAAAEFTRAIELDPKYSPAYTGMGIVYARQGQFDDGLEALDKAEKYADTDQQKTGAWVGYIRLYTAGGEAVDDDWLDRAEDYYEKAVDVSPAEPAPYYYMGMAYKQDYRFSAAAGQLRKVLNLDKDFVAEADQEYAVIQKIERAMPGTTVGKKIALLDSISRADV
ncbi:MAG: tetratricopeptide repeat protein, partial [Desulfosudaceae bacterium]